jgi:hypothetical protein
MARTGSFSSWCPKCGRLRRQDRYGPQMLTHLLSTGERIEAYCFRCDETWVLSPAERDALASALPKETPLPGG